MSMMSIPLDMIVPNPQNPRQNFDAESMAELTASIKSVGVIQPVIVVIAGESQKKYRLLDGERRWRAAGLAGLTSISAIIRKDLTEIEELEDMVTANLQRRDMSPVEEARGFMLLLDAGLTQEELAGRLGKSQSHIANRLRLLELPESVQWNISRGIISVGQAKEILAAKKDGPEFMGRLGERVIEKELSVREISGEIKRLREEITAERAAEEERKRDEQREAVIKESMPDVLVLDSESTYKLLTRDDPCQKDLHICQFRRSVRRTGSIETFEVCLSPLVCVIEQRIEHGKQFQDNLNKRFGLGEYRQEVTATQEVLTINELSESFVILSEPGKCGDCGSKKLAKLMGGEKIFDICLATYCPKNLISFMDYETTEKTVKDEMKRLQKEELARQEAIREPGFVWNDVMLFEQDEDAEPEHRTFLRDMWARGTEHVSLDSSIDVIIGHATDSLEYMRSDKCNTCTFKAEINFQDERYFKTRCINPDRTCWGTLMDEGHSKGKQVIFPDADEIDGVDDVPENKDNKPEIVNEPEPIYTMENTFGLHEKCPLSCSYVVHIDYFGDGENEARCTNKGLFDHIKQLETPAEKMSAWEKCAKVHAHTVANQEEHDCADPVPESDAVVEDWENSRPLPDCTDCKECNVGQTYLIDPTDGETQTLRCTEPECWELKMQEQEPVYTMSNTFLYTAKCPENCEHVVTVMDHGYPFKVCSNGECEFNKPEKIEATSISDQGQWSAILNTVSTHVNCPNGCKYSTLIKRSGIESKRCVNPEFSSIAFYPDIAREPNPDIEEKWQTCRGVFDDAEHIPKVENNLLEVNKPSGDLLEQRKSRMPKDLNTHFNCPDGCKFKIRVEDKFKITGFNHRCTNPEFIDNFCTPDGEFNQDSHEAWKACRGVFEETTVAKSNVLPVKENPQFEPKSTHNTHENCPDECMFRIPAGNGIKRDRCGNGEFGTPCKNWAEFEENSKMFRACRGFSAPASEKKEEPQPEPAVSEDVEQVSQYDKTCHYIDNTGRVLFVTYGSSGSAYRTFYQKGDNEFDIACMRTTSMPYVDSREEAEENLVEYATKRGWKKVGQEEPGQTEADPFDQPREFSDKVHALMGKHIKTPYGTGGVVIHVVGPLEDGFYSLTYKNQYKSDNYINSITLKDGVILCEGVPLFIEKDEPEEQTPIDMATRLLSLPLDSEEYKFLLGSASDKELDMALFRDMRENGRFRIQAERDRRLLAQVNGQLVGMGASDTDKNRAFDQG